MNPFWTGFLVAAVLFTLSTFLVNATTEAKQRRALRRTLHATPPYVPIDLGPELTTPDDNHELLSDYEDAVAAFRDHLQIHVASAADEAAHLRDSHTLHTRLRALRLAVLDRLPDSESDGPAALL